MNGTWRVRRAAGALLVLAALVLRAAAVHAQQPEPDGRRSLADALTALQAEGLRIVFTSATVTPDLRVRVEPRAGSARQRLDELLAPHGLKAEEGPGGILQIVRAAPRRAETGSIEGRILHAFTAAPLAGVAVQIDGLTRESRTDAGGRFLVRRVDAGTRILSASAPGYAKVTRAVQVARGATAVVTLNLSPAAGTHTEQVTVTGRRPYRADRGVASETSLDRSELERLHGSLADDPVLVVQAFPRVSAVDDFRSEFAVRGSPFRHAGVVIDGVSTTWLQHTAHGRGATGSLPMLGGQVLEEATLRAGAYPHRFSDRLGPQLELTLREGSRAGFALRGAVGGTNATVVGEGPLGRSARGSWLVAARQSYLEWPTERADSSRAMFGFADGLAKVIYDVRPSQQVGLSVLAGASSIDGDDNLAASDLGDGTNRASLVNLSWRSTFGSSVVLNQRAYVVRQRFINKNRIGDASDRGTNEELAYRAGIARPIGAGLLEAGAQIGRIATQYVPRPPDPAGAAPSAVEGPALSEVEGPAPSAVEGSSWVRAGYVHAAWAATPALTLSPGLRVTQSTLMPNRTVTRWLLTEWTFRPRWALTAAAGVSHQLPEPHQVLTSGGSPRLRPERATQLDVAMEQRVTKAIRWQATVFSRHEDDVLREPDTHPRLVGDVIVWTDRDRYANALNGSSRGIELLVDRRSATGLSGWAAYSYGRTRHIDTDRHEMFWADFDQRHALSLFGVYRFANHAGVGAVFRAGTNFPIPGYLAARDGGLFVAQRRNQVRLPAYARLDVRADRGFEYLGRRLTLFVEVLNALNRANAGLANGEVDPFTGEATGFTDALFRRRASAGVVIEF